MFYIYDKDNKPLQSQKGKLLAFTTRRDARQAIQMFVIYDEYLLTKKIENGELKIRET